MNETSPFKVFWPDSTQEEDADDTGVVNATPPAPTLDELVEHYRANLKARVESGDYSKRRMPVTLSYVARFLAFEYRETGQPTVRIGSLRLVEAKQAHLVAWLVANYEHWRKGSTRADALGSVLGCFNWLEETRGLLSPFRRPKHIKMPKQHRRAMRKEHYRSIQRTARKCKGSLPFRTIFFCAWHAGVRLIEFRQLEPEEIDWSSSVVRLPPDKNKTGRVTAEERIIGLGPRLIRVLRKIVNNMAVGQRYVFVTARRKPWSKDNLGRKFAHYRELAGVPEAIKMYALRHGYAFRMLSDGQTSNKAVADQLGHRSTRMVDSIYGAETRREATGIRDLAARAERGKRGRRSDTPLWDGVD